MQLYDLEVYNNDFKSKADFSKFLGDTLEPLKTCFIKDGTRINIENVSSSARDSVTEVEGFMRILWGLASDDSYDKDSYWWQKMRQGLINGTNPDHPSYFGVVGDYDQRLVEMASIGYSFVLRPECIYEPMSDLEKQRLIRWLEQINEREAHHCNWKFFRVMVDIGFERLGIDYDREKMTSYLDDLDTFYVGEGWYRDGDAKYAHVDYYGPFAMHYYGLFYAKYMKHLDPVRAKRYEDRAVTFAKTFIYWFDSEGAALPYGRSLTYRYAQMAFFTMLAASDIELPFDIGVIKGIICRHLRWWHDKPIYNRMGQLTVGYAYPNRYMAEDYNAPGSVYWALKGLILLTLPDDHAFWQAEELPLPDLEPSLTLSVPRMIMTRDKASKHVIAYNGGSYHTNAHTHVECKYEKFAYSSFFGFSVPKSHKSLAFGAFDSTLAVSEDGRYYRHKEKCESVVIEGNKIISTWKPFADVTIETTLTCDHPHHIREHKITTNRKLEVAEGGYAIGLESQNGEAMKMGHTIEAGGVFTTTNEAYSCIVGYSDNQIPKLIWASCDTNIMNSKTAIPTLVSSLEPGEHILKSYVTGDVSTLLNTTNNTIDTSSILQDFKSR